MWNVRILYFCHPESNPVCVCEVLALPPGGPKDKLVKSRAQGGWGRYVLTKQEEDENWQFHSHLKVWRRKCPCLGFEGITTNTFQTKRLPCQSKKKKSTLQYIFHFKSSLGRDHIEFIFPLSCFNLLSLLYFYHDRPIIEFKSLYFYVSIAATFVS